MAAAQNEEGGSSSDSDVDRGVIEEEGGGDRGEAVEADVVDGRDRDEDVSDEAVSDEDVSDEDVSEEGSIESAVEVDEASVEDIPTTHLHEGGHLNTEDLSSPTTEEMTVQPTIHTPSAVVRVTSYSDESSDTHSVDIEKPSPSIVMEAANNATNINRNHTTTAEIKRTRELSGDISEAEKGSSTSIKRRVRMYSGDSSEMVERSPLEYLTKSFLNKLEGPSMEGGVGVSTTAAADVNSSMRNRRPRTVMAASKHVIDVPKTIKIKTRKPKF